MRLWRYLLIYMAVVALLPAMSRADGPASIVVDTSAAGSPVSSRLFGHNLSYCRFPDNAAVHHTPAADLWAWDVRESDPAWDVKGGRNGAVSTIIRGATGDGALIRFPNGDWSDLYHWRRGVGWPPERTVRGTTVQGSRPYDVYRFNSGQSVGNEFGTDELMAFIHTACPNAKPLITVNWWDFNRPGRPSASADPHHQPQSGIQEAANWVEYCNGRSPGLAYGLDPSRNWRPSRFVDPQSPSDESTSAAAVESADGIHSWLSYGTHEPAPDPLPDPAPPAGYYGVPKGYFAWLRDYNAWVRNGSRKDENGPIPCDPGPYHITYWEIGNEPAWKWTGGTTDSYRRHAQSYCDSVNACAAAMKAVDPSIKVGACLEDRLNISIWNNSSNSATDHLDSRGALVPLDSSALNVWTPDPGQPGNWDTLLLTKTGANIDFVTVHPYTGGWIDKRYSETNWSDVDPVPGVRYQSLTLDSSKRYTFWVRARGRMRSGTTAPRFSFYLIPCADPGGQCASLSADPKYRLRSGSGNHTEVPLTPTFTRRGSDYAFRVEGLGGRFVPWVHLANRGEGRSVEVQAIYYEEGRGDEEHNKPAGNPTLVEIRRADDQTQAVFAEPIILGRRFKQIKDYISAHRLGLELGCTEYGYRWTVTAKPDQMRTLKGALADADVLREMMVNGVDFACYTNLHSTYAAITQSKGAYDFLTNWEPDQDLNEFFPSAQANLMKLLVGHWGAGLLPATVTSDAFDSPAYDQIVAMPNTPYLSVAASNSSDDRGGRTIYVLVINKHPTEAIKGTVTLDHLNRLPTEALTHTFRYRGRSAGQAALDAQNDRTVPDRISTRTDHIELHSAEPGKIACTFPAASVTVLEIRLDKR